MISGSRFSSAIPLVISGSSTFPKFWLFVGWIDLPSTRKKKFFGWGKSWNQLAKPVWAFVLALPIVWK